MTSIRVLTTVVVMGAVVAAAPACEEKADVGGSEASHAPTAIGIAECAACGMVVREQPAPRAQLVHRDGTRAHLCSVDELARYLAAPSPHGGATAVFVEDLEVGFDPSLNDSKERPWVRADSAFFIAGIKRERVMGIGVLSYGKREHAELAAKTHDKPVKSWSQLQQHVLATK